MGRAPRQVADLRRQFAETYAILIDDCARFGTGVTASTTPCPLVAPQRLRPRAPHSSFTARSTLRRRAHRSRRGVSATTPVRVASPKTQAGWYRLIRSGRVVGHDRSMRQVLAHIGELLRCYVRSRCREIPRSAAVPCDGFAYAIQRAATSRARARARPRNPPRAATRVVGVVRGAALYRGDRSTRGWLTRRTMASMWPPASQPDHRTRA